MEYPYKVYNRDGRSVLAAAEGCRYDKETERSLQNAGHTIMYRGRLIPNWDQEEASHQKQTRKKGPQRKR